MSKRYRLIVFDWEGTLGDTLGQIINHVAKEAKRLNFGELNEKLARSNAVFGLVHAVSSSFPHLSWQQHQELMQAVQMSLQTRQADVYLFPGTLSFIERLSNEGYDLAVATNKGQQSLQRALQLSGLHQWIKVTRSAGQTAPKPDPQMLHEIIDFFAVPAQEALMVGDSASDIDMAKALGVDAVGVDFYGLQASELREAGALAVFKDFNDLFLFINRLNHQGID